MKKAEKPTKTTYLSTENKSHLKIGETVYKVYSFSRQGGYLNLILDNKVYKYKLSSTIQIKDVAYFLLQTYQAHTFYLQ